VPDEGLRAGTLTASCSGGKWLTPMPRHRAPLRTFCILIVIILPRLETRWLSLARGILGARAFGVAVASDAATGMLVVQGSRTMKSRTATG